MKIKPIARFSLICRIVLVSMALSLANLSFAASEWMGIYLQGQKIGYSYSESMPAELDGKSVTLSRSRMEIGTQMLGASMKIQIDTSTWSGSKGEPLKSEFRMESAGRTMVSNALYFPDRIVASMITGDGETNKTIPVPKGRTIVLDATEFATNSMPASGTKLLLYSPETLELVEVTIKHKGAEKITFKGTEVTASVVEIEDPRASSTLYMSSKGDLLKMTGPMGIEMIPETEEEARKFTGTAQVDLASASRIPVDGSFDRTKAVRFQVTGADLSKLPSGGSQIVGKKSDGWVINLKPAVAKTSAKTISAAARGVEAKWLSEEPRVPSNDPEFKSLSQEILGKEREFWTSVKLIRDYVHERMGVNAGIGVMRDAKEILKSQEGVCRDHAILTGTILRSAGIATRFANGLVYFQGDFYYHAWVEVWDGEAWYGVDSTRPGLIIDTGYIKTSQGTVGQALQGFLLDGAKIKVIAGTTE